jgi:hypothetical protein
MAPLFVYCVGRFDGDGVASDSLVPVNGEMCSNHKEQQCNIIPALSGYITRGRPGGGDWAASPDQRDVGGKCAVTLGLANRWHGHPATVFPRPLAS